MQGLYSEHPPRAATNIESLSIIPFHSDRLSLRDIWYNKYSMGPFYVLMGHRSNFLNFNIFLSLKIVFILANSADPD